MGVYDDILVDDAATLCDPDFFGEGVTYISNARGATPRDIPGAIVIRDPISTYPGLAAGRTTMPKMIVKVPNDPVRGISSSQINYGGDKIRVAYLPGTAAQDFLCDRPKDGSEAVDVGMLTLHLY